MTTVLEQTTYRATSVWSWDANAGWQLLCAGDDWGAIAQLQRALLYFYSGTGAYVGQYGAVNVPFGQLRLFVDYHGTEYFYGDCPNSGAAFDCCTALKLILNSDCSPYAQSQRTNLKYNPDQLAQVMGDQYVDQNTV